MKKKLLLLLALVLALALFGTALVGCKDKGPSDEILSKLLNDVDRYYRNESEVTNSNYGVLSSMSTQTDDGEVEVKISWKASSDKISIASKVNAQNMYLVTIPDRSTLTADLSYTLTATLVDEGGKAYEDADGKTYSVSFNRKVNAIGSLYAKMEFVDDNYRTHNADKTEATWKQNDITVLIHDEAIASTKYVDNVAPIRIYVGGTVTISYPQPFKVISLDVNTFYVNSLDGVTLDGATVARANKTVVITLDQPATEFTFSITKQLRLHALEVYREGAPELADLPEIDTTTYGDTEAEILAALQQLPEGSTLSGGQKQYTLTGTIESIDTAFDSQYSQITVTITVGEVSIQCFQMTTKVNLAVGDEIKVTGTLTNYEGKYEFDVKCTYVKVSGDDGGDEETPEHQQSTIDALVDNPPSADMTVIYEVEGIWVPTGNSSDQYGNGYLVDPSSGKKIQIYGMAGDETAFTFSGGVYSFTNPKTFQQTKNNFEAGDSIKLGVAYVTSYKNYNAYFISKEDVKANIEYSITYVDNAEKGTVSFSKSEHLIYGEQVTATVQPQTGYKVVEVKFEGSVVEPEADGISYKFNVAPGKNTFEVTFADENAKAVKTLTIDFTPTNTGLKDKIGFNSTAVVEFEFATLTFQAMNCKKASSDTAGTEYGYLMLNRSSTCYLANKEAIPGYITKIEVLVPTKSSGSAEYHVSLSKTAILEYKTVTSPQKGNNAADTTITVNATLEDQFQYFNISGCSAANGQIAKITITYTEL